jgi:hypothetical protein
MNKKNLVNMGCLSRVVAKNPEKTKFFYSSHIQAVPTVIKTFRKYLLGKIHFGKNRNLRFPLVYKRERSSLHRV